MTFDFFLAIVPILLGVTLLWSSKRARTIVLETIRHPWEDSIIESEDTEAEPEEGGHN